MAQMRKTLLVALAGPIVLTLATCTMTTADHPECKGPSNNQYVMVYDNGTVDKECVRISRDKHQIFWRSASGKPLTIEFTVPQGKEQPFRNMDCLGSSCKVHDCHDDACNSGPANPKVPAYTYYDYHSSVGLTKGGDPGVMIDP